MRKERSVGETAVNIARAIDVGTISGAFILGVIFPPLLPAAMMAIEFSVVTMAGTEIIGSEIKRRNK